MGGKSLENGGWPAEQAGVVFVAPLSLPHERLEGAYEESLNLCEGLAEYCRSAGIPFVPFDFIEESREGGFQAGTWKLDRTIKELHPRFLVAYLVGHPYDVDYRYLGRLSESGALTTIMWANRHCLPEKGVNFGKYFHYICIPSPELRKDFLRSGLENRLIDTRWGTLLNRSRLSRGIGALHQDFDVTLIASKSAFTDQLEQEFASHKVRLQCFGRSFNSIVPYNQRQTLFARSKIHLVLPAHDFPHEPETGVTPLVTEVASSQTFQIAWRFQNMNEYFKEDKEIICAGSVAEFVEKINYYLVRPRHRDQIVEAAYQRSRQELPWTAEWQKIFSKTQDQLPAISIAPAKSPGVQHGLISVVIPCFNQARHLRESVESVTRQTYPNWECIIVDDGSTDESGRVAKDLARQHRVPGQIRVLEKVNGGLASARNVGITESKGEFIIPLDADDILESTMMEKVYLFITQNSRVGFVYPQIELFGSKTGRWPEAPYDLSTMLRSNSVPYCSIFRRELFDSVGGYNSNMVEGFEDWDFWVSAIAAGWRGMFLPEALVRYRVKENSMITRAEMVRPRLTAQLMMNSPLLYDAESIARAELIVGKNPIPVHFVPVPKETGLLEPVAVNPTSTLHTSATNLT